MGEIWSHSTSTYASLRHLGAIFQTSNSGRPSRAAMTLVSCRKQVVENTRRRHIWAHLGTPSCGLSARLALPIGAPTHHEVPVAHTSTQIVVRRRAAPVLVVAPAKTLGPGPSQRLCSSRPLVRVGFDADVEGNTRRVNAASERPAVDVSGRSTSKTSAPFISPRLRAKPARLMPAAYSLETRGAATASPAALKRRANRLGPRRVVAPGVHQNQLQKPRPRAGFFVTISCEMLRELWSGRRDVAPLGGLAQRTHFNGCPRRRARRFERGFHGCGSPSIGSGRAERQRAAAARVRGEKADCPISRPSVSSNRTRAVSVVPHHQECCWQGVRALAACCFF